MKKQLLFIASLFATYHLSAQTQIPNGDFEAWSFDEQSQSEQPTSWYRSTLCDQTSCLVYGKKTTDSHSGYAAKIITLKESESGKISCIPLGYGAVSYYEKPTKLIFWYKSSASLSASLQ